MATTIREASPQTSGATPCQSIPFPVPFTIDTFQTQRVNSAAQQATRNGAPSASSSTNNVNLHPADRGVLSLMPASIRSRREVNGHRNMDVIERAIPEGRYLQQELSIPRLNEIHDSLWFAGRPMPPRPLSYQLAAGRLIVALENVHFHAVWEPGRMFLKPIPRYLLSRQFWEAHLVCSEAEEGRQCCSCLRAQEPANPVDPATVVCERKELYKCAYGLLLSYTALIQYESDFHIAKDYHLLPEEVEWETWRKLSWELLEDSPKNLAKVNQRYLFGELRASRLNKIVRFRAFSAVGTGFIGLMRGYLFEFSTYKQQLGLYFTSVAAVTVYIALALTALQVGLATNELKDDSTFHRASYGFTVFAILGPLLVLGGVFILVLIFVIFNYWSTKTYFKLRSEFYGSLGVLL